MKKTTAHGRKLARMASNGAGHIQLPVTIRFFAKDETALHGQAPWWTHWAPLPTFED